MITDEQKEALQGFICNWQINYCVVASDAVVEAIRAALDTLTAAIPEDCDARDIIVGFSPRDFDDECGEEIFAESSSQVNSYIDKLVDEIAVLQFQAEEKSDCELALCTALKQIIDADDANVLYQNHIEFARAVLAAR